MTALMLRRIIVALFLPCFTSNPSFMMSVTAFSPPLVQTQRSSSSTAATTTAVRVETLTSSSSVSSSPSSSNKRVGLLQTALNIALESPLWKLVLVPQARQKMMDTAKSNGIPWQTCRDWIQSCTMGGKGEDLEQQLQLLLENHQHHSIPSYYSTASFHAYEKGNLCWEAAWEQEIASAAVGARNFPTFGKHGETAFRQSFQKALLENGAASDAKNKQQHPPDDSSTMILLDLGCGTGTSTRWLAEQHPEADQIIGIDMSPYFIHVGKKLLELEPSSILAEDDDSNNCNGRGTWVNAIRSDDRIEFRVGAAENTGLADNSVDVVNLMFVAHECPAPVTLSILREAHRVLKPNTGQLWFCEMDFETPGYAAQRANPLLFSLIRSTEPYLDDYADAAEEIQQELKRLFVRTVIAPATGRHFAIVATKGGSSDPDHDVDVEQHVLNDLRFDDNGVYKIKDTHLILWDNKEK